MCKKFEEDVKTDWRYDPKISYSSSTDTLIDKIKNQYKDCIIGKDTAYIIGLWGRHYNLELSGKPKICSDPVKFAMEYPVRTPKYPYYESDGIDIYLYFDSLSIIRCVQVVKVNARGVY